MRLVYLTKSVQLAVLLVCIFALLWPQQTCFELNYDDLRKLETVLPRQKENCTIQLIHKRDFYGIRTDNLTEMNETDVETRTKREAREPVKILSNETKGETVWIPFNHETAVPGPAEAREQHKEMGHLEGSQIEVTTSKTADVKEKEDQKIAPTKGDFKVSAKKAGVVTEPATISRAVDHMEKRPEQEAASKEVPTTEVAKEYGETGRNLKLKSLPSKDLSDKGHKDVVKVEDKDQRPMEAVRREDKTDNGHTEAVKEHKETEKKLSLDKSDKGHKDGAKVEEKDGEDTVKVRGGPEFNGHNLTANKSPGSHNETPEAQTADQLASTSGEEQHGSGKAGDKMERWKQWNELFKKRGSRWYQTCVAVHFEQWPFRGNSPLPMIERWTALVFLCLLFYLLEWELVSTRFGTWRQGRLSVRILGFIRTTLATSAAAVLLYSRLNWSSKFPEELFVMTPDFPCCVEIIAFCLAVCFILEMIFHRVMRGEILLCAGGEYDIAQMERDRGKSYIRCDEHEPCEI